MCCGLANNHFCFTLIILKAALDFPLFPSFLPPSPVISHLPVTQNSNSINITTKVTVCACMLSRVQLLVTSWTVACQAPLSMGFSRQQHWSGLPFPSPGDLPNLIFASPAIGRWIVYLLATWEVPLKSLQSSNG